MAIYVQSRGKNQDRDYRWLRIKSDESYPENSEFLRQSIGKLSIKPVDLIESQKFSVILVATRNDYCLLITGLKAREERVDFTGRSVRNSLLWVCRKDENERQVRSLLIRALQGELDRELDRTISISGEYGFEVDHTLLKNLANSTSEIANNQNTDLKGKIGQNSESLRQELALELENNTLPDTEGLLVLITSIKSAPALKATGVWRGLSNRVETEFQAYSASTVKQPQKKTVLLGIAIALVLIIAIALSAMKFSTRQKPQPEIIPTPSTIQKNSPTTSKENLNSAVNPLKTKKIN